MIRIITETTFGYRKGKTIEPKTKDSEPFELTKKREKELVEMGIAEYVEQQEEENPLTVKEATQDTAEQKAPEKETAEDSADENQEEGGDEAPGYTFEELAKLKLDELITIGELHNVKYEKGTKKGEFVKIVYEAMDKDDDDEIPDLTV